MKSLFKNILVFSAIALGVSCQKNDVESLGENVKIFVDIEEEEFTRVSDDGSCFVEGDQIQVENTSRSTNNSATFIFDGSAWSTNGVILWEGQGVNEFHAWHPATASFGNFTIPSDQSEGVGQSDWMTASASATPADGGVKLGFRRHLSKVTVEIVGWGDEYIENAQTVDRLDLISLSGVMNNIGKAVIGDDNLKTIQTYVTERNKSMVAIIAPGSYSQGDEFMKIYVNGNTTPLSVKVAAPFTLKPGMAYNLKLKIGKDGIVISAGDISVRPWSDVDLDDVTVMPEPVPQIANYIDEYGINHGHGVEIDGVIWAPVNCGYHATDYKWGKLYQWGRKYGQGYGETYSESEPTISRGPVRLEIGQSEDNKNIFYTSSNESYNNWLNEQETFLWYNTKRTYDPCPDGWRIASYDEYLSLLSKTDKEWVASEDKVGYLYKIKDSELSNSSLFFPASGYRAVDGSAAGRTTYGRYWTGTSQNAFYSYYIRFSSASAPMTGDTGYRANGYSVRCVKE